MLIISFCAFTKKGEGAPAINDLVQRENNGTVPYPISSAIGHMNGIDQRVLGMQKEPAFVTPLSLRRRYQITKKKRKEKRRG